MCRFQNYRAVNFIILALMSVSSFSSCSSPKLQSSQKVLTHYQQNKSLHLHPLITNVKIPPDFFNELFPGYLNGITTALQLPATSTLSALQLAELVELVRQSKATGTIYEVSVLAWGSDKKDLKGSAARNIDSIKETLMPLVRHPAYKPSAVFASYNMEVSPSLGTKLLQTKEARIKSHFLKIDSTKMFSQVMIAISTSEQKNFVHPEMTVL